MTKLTQRLTRIKWALFGKPKEVLLAEEAKTAGVPYEQIKFWPARFAFGRDDWEPRPWTVNRMICPELYSCKVGDVVPVYISDSERFMYQVLGFSWAAGDDHIVSPRQFHIRFAGRLALQDTPHVQ